MQLFNNLQIITDGASTRLSASLVPGYNLYRIGKDQSGKPCLIISVSDIDHNYSYHPISLEHVIINHGYQCRIIDSNGISEEGKFSIIQCISTDPLLQAYFLRVCSVIILLIGENPNTSVVSNAVDKIATLFSALSSPPKNSLQGLWAELFIISQSFSPSILAEAWHITPEDHFDFALGNQRIEIKSTNGSIRRHSFSLEQLIAPVKGQIIIASLFVQTSGAGISIIDLLDIISKSLSSLPGLQFKIEQSVAATLGDSWRLASDERFDIELAKQSLRFYDAKNVPSIPPDIPPGVSNIRFVSDLTNVTQIDLNVFSGKGSLFRSVKKR
ncbi:PD-(D/E)XK motif protein [Armatimonas sp.]|uniref:PD-(D/E)XK motif protein n=1 Tax=Armatimonas sp. TaxID=1872638 RepID=UPI00286BDEC5|nr:PD-(D/E)XK motif protein [Armatimonas sp.]